MMRPHFTPSPRRQGGEAVIRRAESRADEREKSNYRVPRRSR